MRQRRIDGQRRRPQVQQAGVTLIELMVAMVIGLILSGTVIQIFIGSNETYRFQESLSRIQENGRYAINVLASDLRRTDYRGCAGQGLNSSEIDDLTDGDVDASALGELTDALQGYTHDGGWKPSLDTEISAEGPDQNGDVIRMRSMGFGPDEAVISDEDNQSRGSNLFVDDTSEFDKGDIVLATNCDVGVLFEVNNNPKDGGRGQLTVPGNPQFYENYEPEEISKGFRTRHFYIDDGGGEPVLMRRNHDGSTDEIAVGVERMAFEFGEDTNGDLQVDSYETADTVTDWDGVVAVRASLLVRGPEDNVTDDEPSVVFPPGGNAQTYSDKRLRQVFTTTVSLRNRLQ